MVCTLYNCILFLSIMLIPCYNSSVIPNMYIYFNLFKALYLNNKIMKVKFLGHIENTFNFIVVFGLSKPLMFCL